MTRGDALQWGITIDTDGKRWNVTLTTARKPDWTFDTFEDLVAWLEDQNEGLKIGKMQAKHPMAEAPENEFLVGQADMLIRVHKSCGYIGCTPETPRHGCEVHNPGVRYASRDLTASGGTVYYGSSGDLHCDCPEGLRSNTCPLHGAPHA